MRVREIIGAALLLGLAAAAGEAGLPKPVNLLDRVANSQSRGTYGLRSGKYNSFSWGNRWNQSLGRAPVTVAPYIRGY
jgi:hypothetical protein